MGNNMQQTDSTELAQHVARVEARLDELAAEVRELTHTLACVSILTTTQLDRKNARTAPIALVPEGDSAGQ